jgi:hypothetical protein
LSVKLGQFLVDRGHLRPDQVQVVLREQERRYRLFGQICLDLNFIDELVLLQELSAFHQIPYVCLQEMLLPQETVIQLPQSLAIHCQALLVE